MSDYKKPSSLSVLKTLPPDRQADIYLRMTVKSADWPDTSYAAVRKWLADDGIKTSEAALSEFYSWYGLQQQLTRNESTVAQMLENLKSNDPTLSVESLETAGQMFFSALAIEQQDSLTWKRIQDAKLKLGVLELNRQKFQRDTCELFVKWTADKRAKEIASSDSTNADKIEQLGQLMFGEDWKSKHDSPA